jgi:hypothetical protein
MTTKTSSKGILVRVATARPLPLSAYAFVSLDSGWATAQIDMSQIGNTANWFCEVKPNETCTIQLRAK